MSYSDMVAIVLALNLVALPFSGKDDRWAICLMCAVLGVGLAILNELEKLTGAA